MGARRNPKIDLRLGLLTDVLSSDVQAVGDGRDCRIRGRIPVDTGVVLVAASGRRSASAPPPPPHDDASGADITDVLAHLMVNSQGDQRSPRPRPSRGFRNRLRSFFIASSKYPGGTGARPGTRPPPGRHPSPCPAAGSAARRPARCAPCRADPSPCRPPSRTAPGRQLPCPPTGPAVPRRGVVAHRPGVPAVRLPRGQVAHVVTRVECHIRRHGRSLPLHLPASSSADACLG